MLAVSAFLAGIATLQGLRSGFDEGAGYTILLGSSGLLALTFLSSETVRNIGSALGCAALSYLILDEYRMIAENLASGHLYPSDLIASPFFWLFTALLGVLVTTALLSFRAVMLALGRY